MQNITHLVMKFLPSSLSSLLKTSALATLALLLSSCGESPSDVVLKSSEAAMEGNYAEVVEYVNASDDKKALIKALAEEKIDPQLRREATEKGGIRNYEVIDESISPDGKTAKVTTKTTYGNGETSTSTSDLEKVDGKWLFQDPLKMK